MKFPILVIAYVFVQISSCILTDVPAEELAQTNPIVSTPTYPTLDTESGIKVAALSNPTTIPSVVAKDDDSSQEQYDTTPNLRSAAFAKITWNPVSSMILSTDPLTKSPDFETTFPSNSLPYTTQLSRTNTYNYQTPQSIFENLDHEENELDSNTRVTDMSKGLKTTLNTDLPLLYARKETVAIESSTDRPHTSPGSVDYSLSESENEPTSGTITETDTSFQQNMKNFTEIPLSIVSGHSTYKYNPYDMTNETSFSVIATDFSNLELSAENQEASSTSIRNKTVLSDSDLFVSTQSTSENLDKNNLRETEKMGNETFTTEGMKYSHDESPQSSTSAITELDAEIMEQESNLYYSSLDPNSTHTESPRDREPVETLSFSEKSNEGLELTSRLNLETTPASFLDLSIKNNEMLASTKAMDVDNVTSENFPTNISDTLPSDILFSTMTSPFAVSTFSKESFPQTSSDLNSLQENHTGAITEHTSSYSSYTIPVNSPDQENLSISTLVSNNPTASSDEYVTTTSEINVSSNFQPNIATVLTKTEGSRENKTTGTSISEGNEMEKTTLASVTFTLSNDIGQTAKSSFEMDGSIKYDASTTSNIKNEASLFTSSEKPVLSEISTSTYSPIDTFKDTRELLTTTDANIMTEHYFPLTKTQLLTVTPNDTEESNTTIYLPLHKHMVIESFTDSSTEQSTELQTTPYYLLPSTRSQSLTTVSIDAVESKFSTDVFLPLHEDTHRENSTNVFTEQSTVPQTVSYHPFSSTIFEQSSNSATHNVFSSLKPIYDLSTEETSTSKLESYTITDEISTSLPDSYASSTDVVTTDISSLSSETHREGKHIPFSTTSTLKTTDLSSEYGFVLVTTEKTPVMKAAVNDTEVHYMQIKIEDVNPIDRTNMITAIIQFPADSVYKKDMKVKLARTHQWLDKVLTKEFQNWTGDPFQKDEEPENEIPFGNISIFYVKPTPETNASHITLTFIVYNAWRNRTLPVDFVPGTLNFYSKELKESMNASAVYFYHGLSTKNYDLLSAVFDKYGIIIFTISLAVVGITILVCVVVFYRKKTRQSIHYLADSKLQQNLQEAVGIDLTPASIILQDEKEEKGSKICDDEGWLVPITDVPVAEDNSVPNIQDTKL